MARREFNSTDHLNPEAVAAFVDGELSDAAFRRAARHLEDCEECSAEVDTQRRAANRLRVVDNSGVHAPASLVERLAGMCDEDLDGPGGAPGPRDRVKDLLQSALGALKRRGE
ncbi:anti-sigma factor [Corynebacterium sp. HMSC034A01]|uniref:anti-sigma factor family protein n=1 Tax=Corynebacterium sp. HMSC034A01 TaxID=1739295 RepID=UPI000B2EE06C|nr:anti-sigma factor [Corynebacterium sp. HMSC034A01]